MKKGKKGGTLNKSHKSAKKGQHAIPRWLSTGWPRSYRKSVLLFCVSLLGSFRDLHYIFAVTSGSPNTPYNHGNKKTMQRGQDKDRHSAPGWQDVCFPPVQPSAGRAQESFSRGHISATWIYLPSVQTVVTPFWIVSYYIKWVTTSWTYSN